jgi:hypothetical protein
MHKNIPLIFSGILFFLVALLHLYRLINPFVIMIDGHIIPIWASAVLFIVTGLLSLWMFYSLRE